MNQLGIIETLLNWLMWIGLGALLLIAAACASVGLHRVSRALYARLRPAALVAFAFAAIFVTCEAQKRMQSPATGGTPVVPVVVTPDEIAQGWRLVAETNCEADVYAMPEGVSPSFNWHKRGTFGEWARLDLGGFAFPLGTCHGAREV